MGEDYSYEEMLERCRKGLTPSCAVRAASGRLNLLMGLDASQLGRLRSKARAKGAGLILLGSRVSGPRLRQRTLNPALAKLPLKTSSRLPSSLRPCVDGVEIDKTRIKEYGIDDPRTSDLSLILVDALRTPEQMDALGAELEREFGAMGSTFQLRFLSNLFGQYLRSEEDFLAIGRRYLRTLQSPGEEADDEELEQAYKELYSTVNLGKRPMRPAGQGRGLGRR